MFRFEFEVFGDKQVERELRSKAAHAEDARPAFHVMDEEITAIVSEQFATQGGRGSGGWAALVDSTVAYKAANNLRPEILRATDALYESLINPEHADSLRIIEPQALVRGSHVQSKDGYPYPIAHQQGRGNNPVRKIFDFTELDRRNLTKILQRWLMTGQV